MEIIEMHREEVEIDGGRTLYLYTFDLTSDSEGSRGQGIKGTRD